MLKDKEINKKAIAAASFLLYNSPQKITAENLVVYLYAADRLSVSKTGMPITWDTYRIRNGKLEMAADLDVKALLSFSDSEFKALYEHCKYNHLSECSVECLTEVSNLSELDMSFGELKVGLSDIRKQTEIRPQDMVQFFDLSDKAKKDLIDHLNSVDRIDRIFQAIER